MPDEPTPTAPPARESWPILDARERRVLGVLIEKAKTTPDSYPMSLNALVTGCNQKSARDPVLSLNDVEVEDAMARLKKLGLASRILGGRVDRFRHDLYEAWRLDRIDLALVGELLLRGPQTEGELRSHVSRMESFADLDALRAALKPLVERGLVVYLTAQGRRGTALTHAFHAPAELELLRKQFSGTEASAAPEASAAVVPSVSEERLGKAEAEIARLTEEVTHLRQSLAALAEQLAALRASLGA
jgi:uncharacterized protein YceH (UPF0502 family)